MNDCTAEVGRFMEEFDKFLDRQSARVVLDVGSRDAVVALAFKEYFPEATIYAFECNPPAIELCKKNIGDCKDVILVDKAVSDECGLVDFYAIDPERTITDWPDGNIGASSLYIANPAYPLETYYQNKIVVEAITLERWAADNNIDIVDVIWMDLQGAELKALRGMGDLIKTVKAIYTEVEFKEVYFDQDLFWDIDQYLSSHNFRLCTKLDLSEWFATALYVRNDYYFAAQKKRYLDMQERIYDESYRIYM